VSGLRIDLPAEEYSALLSHNERLHKQNDAMRAILRRLEWNGWGETYCTECGKEEPEHGHTPGCRMAAALIEGKHG
jgi:hypothetical protein